MKTTWGLPVFKIVDTTEEWIVNAIAKILCIRKQKYDVRRKKVFLTIIGFSVLSIALNFMICHTMLGYLRHGKIITGPFFAACIASFVAIMMPVISLCYVFHGLYELTYFVIHWFIVFAVCGVHIFYGTSLDANFIPYIYYPIFIGFLMDVRYKYWYVLPTISICICFYIYQAIFTPPIINYRVGILTQAIVELSLFPMLIAYMAYNTFLRHKRASLTSRVLCALSALHFSSPLLSSLIHKKEHDLPSHIVPFKHIVHTMKTFRAYMPDSMVQMWQKEAGGDNASSCSNDSTVTDYTKRGSDTISSDESKELDGTSGSPSCSPSPQKKYKKGSKRNSCVMRPKLSPAASRGHSRSSYSQKSDNAICQLQSKQVTLLSIQFLFLDCVFRSGMEEGHSRLIGRIRDVVSDFGGVVLHWCGSVLLAGFNCSRPLPTHHKNGCAAAQELAGSGGRKFGMVMCVVSGYGVMGHYGVDGFIRYHVVGSVMSRLERLRGVWLGRPGPDLYRGGVRVLVGSNCAERSKYYFDFTVVRMVCMSVVRGGRESDSERSWDVVFELIGKKERSVKDDEWLYEIAEELTRNEEEEKGTVGQVVEEKVFYRAVLGLWLEYKVLVCDFELWDGVDEVNLNDNSMLSGDIMSSESSGGFVGEEMMSDNNSSIDKNEEEDERKENGMKEVMKRVEEFKKKLARMFHLKFENMPSNSDDNYYLKWLKEAVEERFGEVSISMNYMSRNGSPLKANKRVRGNNKNNSLLRVREEMKNAAVALHSTQIVIDEKK